MESSSLSPPASNLRRSGSAARSRTRTRRGRSSAPDHDGLVLAFVVASALFTLFSFGPFLLGAIPHLGDGDSVGGSGVEWFHKHSDGNGGILMGLGANKTRLALHWLMKNRERHRNGGEGDGPHRDNSSSNKLSLARGVSGLPLFQTPALVGAERGRIRCPSAVDGTVENVDDLDLAYWNDPQGDWDVNFVSPFVKPPGEGGQRKYVTFEPDRGGWNNIRMSMEIVVLFASVTGRTLVLPPDTPFYLLNQGKEFDSRKKHRGFADFLTLKQEELQKHVEIISMVEFLQIEGRESGLLSIPPDKEGKRIRNAAEHCFYIEKSDFACESLYSFLRSVAVVPEIQAGRDCLIFDESLMDRSNGAEGTGNGGKLSGIELMSFLKGDVKSRAETFCTDKRIPIFYGNTLSSARHIHFHAGEKHHRLLNHFYTFIHFTDPKIDNHYKRFVRDLLHYVDPIFCASGKIIKSMERDADPAGIHEGGAKYSVLHIRRGDFQYKKVKISAEEWYENTLELFRPNELIYVATDEKNRTFFDPLAKHYKLRFLDDFSEAAGLDKMDPNYAGMIDTVVASKARIFVGTWFSTFTGYINRMRGYHGMPGNTSYYSTLDRKFNTHEWIAPDKVMTAREWPIAWVGIDGDNIAHEEGTLS